MGHGVVRGVHQAGKVHPADDVQSRDLATLPAGVSRRVSSAAKAALRVGVAKLRRTGRGVSTQRRRRRTWSLCVAAYSQPPIPTVLLLHAAGEGE